MAELFGIRPWEMDDLTLSEYVSAWWYLRERNSEG